MVVLNTAAASQYCPDQSHDGVWSREGKQPKTRAFWPSGFKSFDAAITAYNGQTHELPVIDIGDLL